MRSAAVPALTGALLTLATAGPARGQASDDPAASYRFDVRLDMAEGVLEAGGAVRLRNDGAEPLEAVPLVLYPSRFRELARGINDVNFDRYYRWWFDEGAAELAAARAADGAALAVEPAPLDGLPDGVAVRVRLAEPVPPGGVAHVELEVRVEVPDRLGPFGRRGDQVVLEGGALPFVPARGPDGARDPRGPPAPGDWDLRVAVNWEDPDAPGGVVVGGRALPAAADGAGQVALRAPSPSFAAGPDLAELVSVPVMGDAPAVRVYGEESDHDRAQRLRRAAQEAGAFLRERYLAADAPRGEVAFVPAPLRDRFVEVAADDVVLYSDRLYHVFVLLQTFHEVEAFRGAALALVRQALEPVDLGPDRAWAAEAVAWVVTRDWLERRPGLKGTHVRTGLGWFDWIPAIDRILRAPKFAGADVFYGRFHEDWLAVPDGFARALSGRQRGRVVAEKLRERLGDEALVELARSLLAEPAGPGLRERAAAAAGEDLTDFFALWLGPTPEQNLVLDDVETVEELEAGERIRVRIRREGDPRVGAVGEPVEVEAEGPDGEPVRGRWDGRGMEGEVDLVHDGGLFSSIRVDPDLRVAQAYRGDDARPRLFKLLVNRFAARVDLNDANKNEVEAGITIHPFYDYAHAIVLDGFVEEDEQGLTLGYGYGFGQVIDQRSFGAGISGFLNGANLTTGTIDNPNVEETDGTLASAGGGFAFDTRLNEANPTWGFGVQVGLEYSDKVFGTDFRFLSVTGEVELAYSIVRGTLLAVEVVMGQVEGDPALIPSQRLFDVGGSGTVRGVEQNDFLGTGLVAVRTEVRQMLLQDLDVPILWLAWLRKVQVVAFLDTGDVGHRIDDVIRAASDWKWGAGGGIRLWLDAFGVTSVTARFDVGIRVDETEGADPQFYFGVGQSF